MPWRSRSIAVTGANGQLGKELCRQLGPAAVPLPRAVLDITSPSAVRSVIESLEPAVVINCAAWTAVDRAEQEPDACFLANAKAVGWLADACRSVDALLVQVSTDYVFGADRDRRTPYREDDATGPLSTYGNSKVAGEDAARTHENHLIVRTCGLYSAGDHGPVRGRNFLDTMLVLAESRSEV
ncbi:MAG: SDR family oxidoreductase, partial [Planctomycetia bacterium]